MAKSPAWTRKEGQNPEGGLNAKGRASAKAAGRPYPNLIDNMAVSKKKKK